MGQVHVSRRIGAEQALTDDQEAFWESVPINELELALDEITELHEAAGDALAAAGSGFSTRSTRRRSTSCNGQAAAPPQRKRLLRRRSKS
jgi:hypothetical protein